VPLKNYKYVEFAIKNPSDFTHQSTSIESYTYMQVLGLGSNSLYNVSIAFSKLSSNNGPSSVLQHLFANIPGGPKYINVGF
jgi:hypothetical protein